MIAAGAEHTAAVTEDGELYGWGWGRYGNLGLGDRNDRLTPEKVTSIEVCLSLSIFLPLYIFHLLFHFYFILVYFIGGKNGIGGMWMAPHHNRFYFREFVHIWLEQVWSIGAWRFRRPPCSPQVGGTKRHLHFAGPLILAFS
jgi:Regulator of chromosome condensation (RCC1) repeat